MIELGKYNTLKVRRKSDLGYMLTDDKQDILLHFKEASKELEDGEEVTVYVYTDKQNRVTATMNEALLSFDKPNFVKVVNVMEAFGVFVENNTPKDLLISKDYLPYDYEQWPQIGDEILCQLKIKKDHLVAKPLNRFDIQSLNSQVKYLEQEKVEATVLRISEKGVGLVTRDLIYIFVPNSQTRTKCRLGERLIVTITKMLEQEAYGTLNEHKEILMDVDKQTILNYLMTHKGVMKLTAKSSSEDVEKVFNMSRKAFKRAYGALYKEEIIEFDEEKTTLKKAIEI